MCISALLIGAEINGNQYHLLDCGSMSKSVHYWFHYQSILDQSESTLPIFRWGHLIFMCNIYSSFWFVYWGLEPDSRVRYHGYGGRVFVTAGVSQRDWGQQESEETWHRRSHDETSARRRFFMLTLAYAKTILFDQSAVTLWLSPQFAWRLVRGDTTNRIRCPISQGKSDRGEQVPEAGRDAHHKHVSSERLETDSWGKVNQQDSRT